MHNWMDGLNLVDPIATITITITNLVLTARSSIVSFGTCDARSLESLCVALLVQWWTTWIHRNDRIRS